MFCYVSQDNIEQDICVPVILTEGISQNIPFLKPDACDVLVANLSVLLFYLNGTSSLYVFYN